MATVRKRFMPQYCSQLCFFFGNKLSLNQMIIFIFFSCVPVVMKNETWHCCISNILYSVLTCMTNLEFNFLAKMFLTSRSYFICYKTNVMIDYNNYNNLHYGATNNQNIENKVHNTVVITTLLYTNIVPLFSIVVCSFIFKPIEWSMRLSNY